MQEKTDLRIIKTYAALTNAFHKLLSEKAFEEITVNELCNRAVIRRATFYKHFADKYEFLTFVLRQMKRDFAESLNLNPQAALTEDDISKIISSVLDYAEKNMSALRSLLGGSTSAAVTEALTEQMSSDIKTYIKFSSPVSDELQSRLLAGALIQGVEWWLFRRGQISKSEMARQLNLFVCKCIFG
ncbi:MAG: TetR/AcrR family transcriptional regulator [Clostridia bacterium]|nr:TetR/AcrR family transcriptional regulator [Clostridia bacterium]